MHVLQKCSTVDYKLSQVIVFIILNIIQLMVAGHTGVSGLPAVRHVVRVLSPGLIPAQVLLLNMVVWTVSGMQMKSETALSATVLFTASGYLFLIGQTVPRAVTRELVGGQGTSSRRNTVEITVVEMQLKLRCATHRRVRVRCCCDSHEMKRSLSRQLHLVGTYPTFQLVAL